MMDRPTFAALWRGSAIFAALAAAATNIAVAAPPEPAAASATYDARDLKGVWLVTSFIPSRRPLEERITRTLEGDPVPMRPWAQKVYDDRLAIARSGERAFADTETYCLPGGVPRVMLGPSYPMQVLQTPEQITIIFEAMNTLRFIYMNASHPIGDDLDVTWMGDSVAKWDGDTLVVDTIGLNDKTQVDKLGLPHSEALHVVERIRRTGADTMENIITIEDPKTFTHPWKTRATYERAPAGTRVMEYVCNENNRNIPRADGTVGE